MERDYVDEWENLIMEYYYEEFNDTEFHDPDEWYGLAYSVDEEGYDIQVSCLLTERKVLDTRLGNTKVFSLSVEEFDHFISNLDYGMLIGGEYECLR